jgi:hypothetical protein
LFIGERFPEPLLAGLIHNVEFAIDERTRRLKEFATKLSTSGDSSLENHWPAVEEAILSKRDEGGDSRLRETFQEKISAAMSHIGKSYIDVIRSLQSKDASIGTLWLQGIVDTAVIKVLKALE